MSFDTKDKILQSALELMAEYPYSEISTEMIIRHANIGKGTLYWHFKSKDEIFQAVFRQCYDEIVMSSRKNLDLYTSVYDKLCVRLSNIIEFGLLYPNKIKAFSQYVVYHNNSNSSPFPYGEFSQDIRNLVIEGLENGELVKLPQDYLISYIYTLNSFLTNYLQEHPEYYEDKNIFEKLLKNLFSGLKYQEDR
jgi:AcrR family transcriptional regulator